MYRVKWRYINAVKNKRPLWVLSHVAHKVCQQGWTEAKDMSSPELGKELVIVKVPSHQPSSVWMRERTHWQRKEISFMVFNSYNNFT